MIATFACIWKLPACGNQNSDIEILILSWRLECDTVQAQNKHRTSTEQAPTGIRPLSGMGYTALDTPALYTPAVDPHEARWPALCQHAAYRSGFIVPLPDYSRNYSRIDYSNDSNDSRKSHSRRAHMAALPCAILLPRGAMAAARRAEFLTKRAYAYPVRATVALHCSRGDIQRGKPSLRSVAALQNAPAFPTPHPRGWTHAAGPTRLHSVIYARHCVHSVPANQPGRIQLEIRIMAFADLGGSRISGGGLYEVDRTY